MEKDSNPSNSFKLYFLGIGIFEVAINILSGVGP
jgi:hypothetical protein